MRVWKSQAKEIALWFTTHGGNVADGTGQAFVSDRFGWMPVGEEVCSLQEPVARQNRFVAYPWTPQCRVVGRIVANPDTQRVLDSARRSGPGAFIYAIKDRPLAELSGIFHYFRLMSLSSV